MHNWACTSSFIDSFCFESHATEAQHSPMIVGWAAARLSMAWCVCFGFCPQTKAPTVQQQQQQQQHTNGGSHTSCAAVATLCLVTLTFPQDPVLANSRSLALARSPRLLRLVRLVSHDLDHFLHGAGHV